MQKCCLCNFRGRVYFSNFFYFLQLSYKPPNFARANWPAAAGHRVNAQEPHSAHLKLAREGGGAARSSFSYFSMLGTINRILIFVHTGKRYTYRKTYTKNVPVTYSRTIVGLKIIFCHFICQCKTDCTLACKKIGTV